MPYVKQERRPDLDKVVEKMVEANLSGEFMEALLFAMYHERSDNQNDQIKSILESMDKVSAKPNGDINYILFKYAKYHIKPSYNNYKAFIGVIYKAMHRSILRHYNQPVVLDNREDFVDEYRESAAEIRRRILGPYEDQKIIENGDV